MSIKFYFLVTLHSQDCKMAKNWAIVLQFMHVILAVICSLCSASNEDRKAHIVYMGSLRSLEYSQTSYHLNLLQSAVESSSATGAYIRSYGRSFNGFAAKLTDREREKLASMEGVVSVFPSKILHTQTTRSWDFIGFHRKIERDLIAESDIIIGSIDTGIWPESESFTDEGLGPPPTRWKGACVGGENFTCNNKIIGARYYSSSSARDEVGHGSHTASTAAGNTVNNASFYGIAEGIARGGAPSARIAAYKVCNPSCFETDILAAFDDAIADGVDVITISVGGYHAYDFKYDCFAIGSFHAMENGILTVHSAGNTGPSESSVTSAAPWLFSVGATTIDRNIIDKVVLGNGQTLVGYSVNSFSTKQEKLPLISGRNASKTCSKQLSEICSAGCLDHDLVKGKIVQCMSFDGVDEALQAGADGSIVLNDMGANVSVIVPLPASALGVMDYAVVAKYANSATNPRAKILKSEIINDTTAPKIAVFSGRGPNPLIPEIMKPDISAPGINILAAFSPLVPPSDDSLDKRSVKYSLLSGTSMSCPHVAGVAAYVKSFHPNWSPSAIKSAIMTTAKQMNSTDGVHVGEYLYGSGQIDPKRAINPGLVYETCEMDYIRLLCSYGYDTKMLRLISGDNSSCSTEEGKLAAKDLNYPAMAAQVLAMEPFVVEFQRTVTNVGLRNSTYRAQFLPFSQVYHIKPRVEPPVLSFESLNQKTSFTVTVAGGGIPAERAFSTSLIWSDGVHSVRSPIIVKVISRPSLSLYN